MGSSADTLYFVGAGALGQAFAGLIAAAGQMVTLIGTPSGVARLLSAGCIRLRGVLVQDVPVAPAPAPPGTVGLTTDPGVLPPRSGVIFTTKGHQLPDAIARLRSIWPSADDAVSWVAGIQNGLLKDELLAAAFGAGRVIGAVTILSAQRDPDGAVIITSRGMTYFGEFTGGCSPRVTAAVQFLKAAGIPAEAAEDIQSVLWSKACNAIGVFGVCVLTRSSASGLMRNPDLVRAYHALIRETAAVAAAYAVPIGDYAGFPIRGYLDKSDAEMVELATMRATRFAPGEEGDGSLPSMLQDLRAGRPMEWDQVFGDMVRRAEKVGVPVPRIALVRDLIAGLNRAMSP